uniref:Putative RxLR effector n=1 Tax=Plasmopara viticola TaxID=143451 RepID=A0A650F4R9_PLAVT|nr:putative RxLR effector [Plasmopara viticola]
MRGAFYVTTALLLTHSVRSAAEEQQQTSHHDGAVMKSIDTESSPGKYLRDSREHHDDLGPSAVDEERTPEASTRIIENSLTLLREEALDPIRKAAYLSLDLNALPEENLTGALEAYNIVRNKDPRTSTASNPEVSSSHLSKKRSLDKASGSGLPKQVIVHRPKKMRLSVPLRTTDVRRSISHGKMTPMPSTVSIKDVHKLYLNHLTRTSTRYIPTRDETKKLLRLVNRIKVTRPSSNIYKPDLKNLMKMELEDLEKLFGIPKQNLGSSSEALLKLPTEDQREIKRCLYQLQGLKRWRLMYRDFFNFCLSNAAVCSNFHPQSALQVELKMKKLAESGASVANYAKVETRTTALTEAERDVLKDLKAAVERANLSETDKKAMYKETVEEVYRDDDQLTSSDLSALIADASFKQPRKRHSLVKYDALKTPLSFGTDEEALLKAQGGLLRDRKKVYELVKVVTDRTKKTNKRYDKAIYEDEFDTITDIHKKFIQDLKLRYIPTLVVTKKMWRMFNWAERPDPSKSTKVGIYLLDDVCLMDANEVAVGLGLNRAELEAALKELGADEEEALLNLKTDYLLWLLETYDKFFFFCEKNNKLCKMPSELWLTAKRATVSRTQLIKRRPLRGNHHAETS